MVWRVRSRSWVKSLTCSRRATSAASEIARRSPRSLIIVSIRCRSRRSWAWALWMNSLLACSNSFSRARNRSSKSTRRACRADFSARSVKRKFQRAKSTTMNKERRMAVTRMPNCHRERRKTSWTKVEAVFPSLALPPRWSRGPWLEACGRSRCRWWCTYQAFL